MTETTDQSGPALKEGENCWEKGELHHFHILPGGRAYFEAFRKAVISARRQIVLLGWDFDTRIDTVRTEESEDGYPSALGPFLEAVLEEKPDLEVYLLIWDFSLIYAAEREWQPLSKTLRSPHPRLHYEVDGELPSGASHHQKVLLIDNEIAFLGGLDLSAWRWDTTERKVGDTRRKDPKGELYDPYHDIHTVFAGPLVKSVRKLCDYRWKRGNGRALPAGPDDREGLVEAFPWDKLQGWDEGSRSGALARTFSGWKTEPDVHEIEQWHLDAIAAAEDCLYFENQYFSSNRLKKAIIERLVEENGPEIVIVLNDDTGGWLEESTMGVMRDAFFREMKEADHEERLCLVHPLARSESGGETKSVYVHAKVVVVDDAAVKIGSSNLSNRSMRVDSEVDLILEKGGGSPGFAHRTRNRLLALHLGVDEAAVAGEIDRAGSVAGAIRALRSDDTNTLEPIKLTPPNRMARNLSEAKILDPEEPVDPRNWIRNRIRPNEEPTLRKRVAIISALILAVGGSAFLLKYGWGEFFDDHPIEPVLSTIRESEWSPLILIAFFVAASLVGFPINVLLLAAAVVFNPWLAFLYGYVGSHLGAVCGFGLGRAFGGELLERFAPKARQTLSERLRGKQGIASVAILRVLPVAPFLFVNVAAGASRLPLSTFNWGTLLGMAPGMILVIFLTDRAKRLIEAPTWGNGAIFVICVFAVMLGIVQLNRILRGGGGPGSSGAVKSGGKP